MKARFGAISCMQNASKKEMEMTVNKGPYGILSVSGSF